MPQQSQPLRRGDSPRDHNSKMVSLIKGKLIPLNKPRYQHLQKITRALKKEQFSFEASAMATHCHHGDDSFQQKRQLSHRLRPSSEVNLLLHRLQHLSETARTNQLWKLSTSKLIESSHSCLQEETVSAWKIPADQPPPRQRPVPLLEVVTKAERHLRVKKRELKERFSHEFGGKAKGGKASDLQGVLNNLRGKGKGSEEQLEKELLQDIRLNMLEEKMNKIKRDINHKKIVQLR